ncbi:MAG: hypothetical protein EOL86_10755 [Deltaproteobacteria bacterium]|nr:hypothetical protein [Deltaproteobacteria bacterium]
MTDHHDRKAHYLPRQRLTLDLYARGKGADDMTLEKVSDYVTCGELIDRLGCLTIEFVKGIRRGIVPKPTSEAGGSRTAETDPAFYDHSLMPSVDEWVKYVRAAKIFRFFAESSWPRMVHELGHCWEVVETATTPPTATTEPGHDQQVEEPARIFKTPKQFADYYRSIEGAKFGWIMLEIVDRWGLKNYAAAAVALGDPVPEKGSEAAKSYGERFRYYTRLLDQSE